MTQVISLMTTKEAAEVLGITSGSVDRLCRTGKLQAEKVGKSWATTQAAIEVYKRSKNKPRKRKKRKVQAAPIITSPKRERRPVLSKDKSNMRRVHERADAMVKARQEFLAKKFPHPKGREVFEYVLWHMPPLGLRDNSVEYEDEEIYKCLTTRK
jgi:excisionase family DNA binding protein